MYVSRVMSCKHQDRDEHDGAVPLGICGGSARRASRSEDGRLIRKVGPQTVLFSGLVAYLEWTSPLSVARGEEPKNDLAVSGL